MKKHKSQTIALEIFQCQKNIWSGTEIQSEMAADIWTSTMEQYVFVEKACDTKHDPLLRVEAVTRDHFTGVTGPWKSEPRRPYKTKNKLFLIFPSQLSNNKKIVHCKLL